MVARGPGAVVAGEDPAARFDLVASAIAGAKIQVRTCPGDAPTHSDGSTIWVRASDVDGDLVAARDAVVVQALVVRHGTVDRQLLRRARRGSVRQREFELAVRRAFGIGSPVPVVGRLADTLADGIPLPEHWGTLLAGTRPAARDDGAWDNSGNQFSRDGDGDGDPPPADVGEERMDLFTVVKRRLRRGTHERRRSESGGQALDGLSSGAAGPRRARGRIPIPLPPGSGVVVDGAARYPEWDERRSAYRPDWCRVREVPVAVRPGIVAPQAFPDLVLRRGVAVLARSLAKVDRQRDGDELDLDAVVRRQVALRSGEQPRDDTHVARLRVRPELTVMVLMDRSSSTSRGSVRGTSIFEEQRATAHGLVDALSAAGLRTAWWAFSSQGRQAVDVQAVKAFDDVYDRETYLRAASLRPGGFSRLGAAIRHASAAIGADAGAGRRLLIVLSDGVAFDHGYEGLHADSDARMALREARARQIGCVSLTVGVDHDDLQLKELFGAEEYVRSRSYESLRADLARLLRATLRSTR